HFLSHQNHRRELVRRESIDRVHKGALALVEISPPIKQHPSLLLPHAVIPRTQLADVQHPPEQGPQLLAEPMSKNAELRGRGIRDVPMHRARLRVRASPLRSNRPCHIIWLGCQTHTDPLLSNTTGLLPLLAE